MRQPFSRNSHYLRTSETRKVTKVKENEFGIAQKIRFLYYAEARKVETKYSRNLVRHKTKMASAYLSCSSKRKIISNLLTERD